MSYHHPPVSHSISSPPSPHHVPPTSPLPHQTQQSRRSSVCTPCSDLSFTGAGNHRRSRSFRDATRSPRQLPTPQNHRYTTFEFDTQLREHVDDDRKHKTQQTQQKRPRHRPPPLHWASAQQSTASSSVCSSASTTQTSVFFNTSTDSNNSSRNYSNRTTQPCSPNNTGFHGSASNWSMCSEYSTTSSTAKAAALNNNFPKGKLAYLASRRGSSGSVCSSTTGTPPNTPGYTRFGASAGRRQSSGNFLEVPPSTSMQSTSQETDQSTSPVTTSPATTPTQPCYSGRSRVNSLPATSLFSQTNLLSPTYPYFPQDVSPTYAIPNPRNDDNYLYRLRTFNITKGGDVVNCGDTFVRKSKSNNCLSEQVDSTSPRKCSLSTSPTRSQRSSPCHRRGSLSPRLVVNYPLLDASCCVSRDESDDEIGADEEDDLLNDDEELTMRELAPVDGVNKRYRVVLLGESGVGKSALVRQFTTSEYVNTFDASLDEEYGEREVSILLDQKESSLVFVDHPSVEMSVENSLSTYDPHACVVVYSVTDKASFVFAAEALRYLFSERTTAIKRSVILVGNKCDLARARVISTQEGKNLATSHDTKFIETSSGIQHNVDELLVGVLKQIRLREEASSSTPITTAPASLAPVQPTPSNSSSQRKDRSGRSPHTPRGSIMGLLFTRELINKLCFLSNKAKSCENLHVL